MTGQNSTLARQAETTEQNEKAEISPEDIGSRVAKILKVKYKYIISSRKSNLVAILA